MMTAVTKDFIEINLSTDELMLKELERRDGIYSFIFHELEVPKVDTTTTVGPSSTRLTNSNYTTTSNTKITTNVMKCNGNTEYNESNNNNDNYNNNNNIESISDALEIKTEFMLPEQSTYNTTIITTTATTTVISRTTTTLTITYSSPITTSAFVNTFPVISSATLANKTITTTTTTTLIVPSLFSTTTPLNTTSTTVGITASTNGFGTTLPYMPTSLSGVSLRSYHNYLKTWHPPPSLLYDNPKLYAYMTNCGFRVRAPTPRFSHITAPLVRNRRHALKETPEYKRKYDVCVCAPSVDLRKLFPYDPDVYAPFAMAMEEPTTMLGEDVGSGVELDDGCCDDVVLM